MMCSMSSSTCWAQLSLMAANSPASDSPRMGFCCISQHPKGYSSHLDSNQWLNINRNLRKDLGFLFCFFAACFNHLIMIDIMSVPVFAVFGWLATTRGSRKGHLHLQRGPHSQGHVWRLESNAELAKEPCRPGLSSAKAAKGQNIHSQGRINDILRAGIRPFGSASHKPRLAWFLRNHLQIFDIPEYWIPIG